MPKAKVTEFKVRVVYGFRNKLKIVLLGDVLKGKVEAGMVVQALLNRSSPIGNWPIIEVLETDFINDEENPDFIGLMLRCASDDDFNLLQSLRVYGETLYIKEAGA